MYFLKQFAAWIFLFCRGVIILQDPFDKRHKKMYNNIKSPPKLGKHHFHKSIVTASHVLKGFSGGF